MDGELLWVLLMSSLSSKTNQKLEAGPTLSSVLNQLKWQKLGAKIRPQLLLNGSNFPHWSASLIDVIASVTHNAKYFDVDRASVDRPTSNGILVVIKVSIDAALRSLLNRMTAYGAYHSLKGRFENPSWLLLLNCWSDVARAPDASDSISASYESLKMSLLDLEEQLGGWTTDKLLSLSFHSSLKSYQQPIADAIDLRLAIIPNLPVLSTNILNTATRLHLSTVSLAALKPSSLMAVSSQQDWGAASGSGRPGRTLGKARAGQPCQNPPASNLANLPADTYGRKFMTPEHPCAMCWEWGHWAPDCPRTKAGSPALEDPRPSNPGWRPKKSSVLSN
jgi:hypothetical protein